MVIWWMELDDMRWRSAGGVYMFIAIVPEYMRACNWAGVEEDLAELEVNLNKSGV